jgi:hypothetical protein
MSEPVSIKSETAIVVFYFLGKKIPTREWVSSIFKLLREDYSSPTTSRFTITETSECTETAIS